MNHASEAKKVYQVLDKAGFNRQSYRATCYEGILTITDVASCVKYDRDGKALPVVKSLMLNKMAETLKAKGYKCDVFTGNYSTSLSVLFKDTVN